MERAKVMKQNIGVPRIIVTYAGTKENAKEIAGALVKEDLAISAHVAEISSFYHWMGEICEAPEYRVDALTGKEKIEKATKRIRELSTYELPIVTSHTLTAEENTRKWMSDENNWLCAEEEEE